MSDSGRLTIDAAEDAGSHVIRVAGEVDLRTSPQLRSALLEVLDRSPRSVFIDLSNVTYMDSSGVGTVVEAKRRAEQNGGKLVLVGLQPRVRSVFEITQLDRFFTIAATLDEARQ